MCPPQRIAFLLLTFAVATPASAEWGWNPFRSKPKEKPAAEAHPVKQASANVPQARRAQLSLELSEEAGPWLILATTFSGDGAEDQARDLCLELRQTLKLPTYLHPMTFDLNAGNEPVGRGVDRYGAPIKMTYQHGSKRKEWAVLVGAYPAVDDTIAERDLATIKSIQPQALKPDSSGHTHQNFAGYRQVTARSGEASGPMRAAFLTRNPILPEEYFVPKGVDPFIEKMNKGLDHSALDIEGRYAVKVATFRARGTLLGANQARSTKVRRNKDKDDPLLEASWNAHFLCEEMRRHGWDAYEFHNRTESCVMVGSFDSVKSATGEPKQEVVKIIRTFGAKYDTPTTPLAKERLPSADAKRKELRQTFNNLFSSEVGQVAGGMNPKYAHVKVSDDEPLKAVPFDIHPHVVEAPKRSISSGFAWGR